jgi:hypothetical protein
VLNLAVAVVQHELATASAAERFSASSHCLDLRMVSRRHGVGTWSLHHPGTVGCSKDVAFL